MRSFFIFLLASGLAVRAAEIPDSAAKPGEATRLTKDLIAHYRKSKDPEEKFKVLIALRKYENATVKTFLQEEYDRQDMDTPAGAKLGGAILQIWAARLDQEHLPALLFEGLFHNDVEVVRASAEAAARLEAATRAVLWVGRAPPGREPQQDLAVDLIARMMERPDLIPPLEKVLVAWSGKKRTDYRPDAKVGDAEKAAVTDFWKQWYEERFRAKFKPPAEGKETGKKR